MPGRRKEFNLWEKRKPPMMECFAGSPTAKQQNKRSQKNIIFMSHRQSMADHRGWLMYAICSDIGFHVFLRRIWFSSLPKSVFLLSFLSAVIIISLFLLILLLLQLEQFFLDMTVSSRVFI